MDEYKQFRTDRGVRNWKVAYLSEHILEGYLESLLNPIRDCADCGKNIFILDVTRCSLLGFPITGVIVMGKPYCFECSFKHMSVRRAIRRAVKHFISSNR